MAKKSVREIQKRRGAEFVKNSTYMNGNKSLNDELQKHPEDRIKTMMKFENSILLRDSRSLMPFHETAGDEYNQESLAHVVTFNHILHELTGYSLSAYFLERIAKEAPEDAKDETEMIDAYIKDSLGVSVFSSPHTFCPNFPEEVMKKDDAELYFNAAAYYAFGTYGLQIKGIGVNNAMKEAGRIEEEAKRNPLLELYKTKEKRIDLLIDRADIGQQYFLGCMKEALHGNLMSETQRNDFLEYAHALCKENAVPEVDFFKIVEGPYASKENEALITAWLHDNGYDDIVFKNNLCKDAKVILPVISDISLKNGAANGAQPRSYGKDKPIIRPESIRSVKSFDVRLNKADKVFIKRLMNKDEHLKENVAQNKTLWKKVMRNIDARKGPERVVNVFDDLAKNNFKDIKTPNAEIDAVLKEIKEIDAHPDHDYTDKRFEANHKLMNIAEDYPEAFLRRVVEIARVAIPSDTSLMSDLIPNDNYNYRAIRFATATAAMHTSPLLTRTIDNLVQKNKAKGSETRIARTKNGTLLIEKEAAKLSPEQKLAISHGLCDARQEKRFDFFNIKFYVESELQNIKAPQRQDVEVSNGSPYSRGSVIEPDEKKNLIMFGMHWGPYMREKGDTDIDIHAFAIKDMDALAKGKGILNRDVEEISFSNPRTDFAVHSSSYTSSNQGGDWAGAKEFVVVDKKKAKEAGFRYIAMNVNSYRSPLRDNPAKMVMMQREGNLSSEVRSEAKDGTQHPVFDGEIDEPSLLGAIGITASGKESCPLVYDLEKNKIVWLDMEIKGMAISKGAKEWSHDNSKDGGYIPSGDSKTLHNGACNKHTLQALALGYLNAVNSPAPSISELVDDIFFGQRYYNGTKTDNIREADVIFDTKPAPPWCYPLGAKVFAATDKHRMWYLLCTGEDVPEFEKEMQNERTEKAIDKTLSKMSDVLARELVEDDDDHMR